MAWTETLEAFVVLRPNFRTRRPEIDRLTKRKPALANNEVAVKVKLKVPSNFFDEYIPVVEAEITPTTTVHVLEMALEES